MPRSIPGAFVNEEIVGYGGGRDGGREQKNNSGEDVQSSAYLAAGFHLSPSHNADAPVNGRCGGSVPPAAEQLLWRRGGTGLRATAA